ncbi:MAG: hypothetical protein DRH17_07395, partial [Deltaproteobacteria bacterium]
MKEAILQRFAGNYESFYAKYLPKIEKIGGNEFKAVCPFHDDQNPSLNFNNQTGQYFCHGCGKKGDAVHFFAKLNSMDTRRDFPKILKRIASDFNIPLEETKRRLVQTYDYTDAQGQLLFQVCRYEPKDFRQRHKKNGKWVWNLKGV